jgi:hypothetical protein
MADWMFAPTGTMVSHGAAGEARWRATTLCCFRRMPVARTAAASGHSGCRVGHAACCLNSSDAPPAGM